MGAMYLVNASIDIEENKKYNLIYGLGYSICETFLINILEDRIDFEDLVLNDENFKDILLRYFQQNSVILQNIFN